ncbi:hypothetical protein [Desulfovibrio sp. ZJ200]|uniref:hypothetical protein n=1 Tax=Desulfovibrio sp. ZJ200 TaxID=2709792 RepID=UPI0013ED29F0|nr:hypothetical protein [Desulfovibrio sp. ZJ200]
MNSFLLMTALRDRLAPALADLPLPTRSRRERPRPGEVLLRPARVLVGSLPPKGGEHAEYDAPLVLIQAMSGHDGDDGFARVVLALRLVVWNEEAEGAENDLHNLLALVRRHAMSCRRQALDGRYILTANERGEFTPWVRPDEQAPPFAEAYALTHWTMQGNE